MKINVLRLKNAPGESIPFHIKEKLADEVYDGQTLNFVGPVEAAGEITNKAGQFVLTGLAKAAVRTCCVSCLEPFELDVQASLDEVYSQSDSALDHNRDIEEIGFSGDVISIGPEVVKSLLMELPMRLICSPGCRGLCPQCGCNLNLQSCGCENDFIDPRLAILKKLK